LAAIALFTAASALCGLASSLDELVAFRILQGAGGGMLAPVGMAMLYRVFPPDERIKAAAILTVPTTFAPALGPVLGGLFVTELRIAMVAVELRSDAPIVDLRLLRNRLFRSGNGVMVLTSTAFLGSLYAISLYYQDGRGLSALGSGLSTFPEALGVMAGAQL